MPLKLDKTFQTSTLTNWQKASLNEQVTNKLEK